MLPEEFADTLKRWRKAKRLLQKEAAAIFETSAGVYRSWEKGSRTPKRLTLREIERRMDAQ